jgi:hypothetical protein
MDQDHGDLASLIRPARLEPIRLLTRPIITRRSGGNPIGLRDDPGNVTGHAK